MRTLVVIPTYNEAESIGALVEQVLAVDQAIDALVVDDGSPDGTADIVRKTMASQPRLHLLERSAEQRPENPLLRVAAGCPWVSGGGHCRTYRQARLVPTAGIAGRSWSPDPAQR